MKIGASRWLCLCAFLIVFPTMSEAQTAPTPDDLVVKHLVSLPSGLKLNINCVGKGTPAVVFEQGLGAHILSWEKVALPISKLTTTCVYDRAGEGLSDPSDRPMTASNITSDLHALLIAAKLKGPIILVGHSIGGLYATLYADRYFSQLAGLVLVDPSFAGQDAAFASLSPTAKQREAAELEVEQNHYSVCAAIARSGKLAEDNAACPWHFAPNRTDVEKAYLGYAMEHPFKYEAEASESRSFSSSTPGKNEDSEEEFKAKRSFGALPLIVLTAGRKPPLQPNESESDRKNQDLSWKRGHDDLATRSTNGKSILAPDAGHFIQLDQPEVVIDAITDVIEKSRGNTASNPGG